jgi:RNA polymerase sigma-70 factor (ECF subfamily)
VFQNTFVAVFTKIAQYEPGRAARPWLYTIATHQAIDAMRRRGRRIDRKADTGADDPDADGRVRSLSEVLPDPAAGPAETVEGAETRVQVRAAVDKLPEGLRQVVILAYFQGLRYQEIADALDIPLGTVKSRLHAAMHRLADEWPSDGS